MSTEIPLYDRPLACKPLISYRYQKPYGELFTGKPSFVMIGAKNHLDAMREAGRSLSGELDASRLQVWDGAKYVSAY